MSSTDHQSEAAVYAAVPSYQVDQREFDQWQLHWNSKQEVIDHLLHELEKSMRVSDRVADSALSIIDDE